MDKNDEFENRQYIGSTEIEAMIDNLEAEIKERQEEVDTLTQILTERETQDKGRIKPD